MEPNVEWTIFEDGEKNLSQWCEHFQLSNMIRAYLDEQGVICVEDLKYAFDDEALLKEMEAAVGSTEFQQFLRAKQFTRVAEATQANDCLKMDRCAPISSLDAGTDKTRVGENNVVEGPLTDKFGSTMVLDETFSADPRDEDSSSSYTEVDADEPTALFSGHDFSSWIAHFGLSERIKNFLTEMGVKEVCDLNHIYSDGELLAMVQCSKNIDKRSRERFRSARNLTAVLMPTRMVKQDLAVAVNEGDLRRKLSVDVAFVMDCTSSMSSYLVALKTNVAQFVESITRIHSAISIRIAFVGYRDYGDVDRHVVLPFTTSVKAFEDIVRAQRATGGGDEAEDVLGGLDLVGRLDWLSETRILYHVGDAPCHGKEYHAPEVSDRFLLEEQEPMGLKSSAVLRGLRSSHIQYIFAKINGSTDLMIKRFNEIAGPPYPYVYETLVTSGNMMDVIQAHAINLASESMSKAIGGEESISMAIRTGCGVDIPRTSTPSLLERSVKREQAIVYRMTMPSSMDEFMSESTDRCVTDFPAPDMMEVTIETKQFARGGLRVAFCGMWHNPPTQPDRPAPWPIVVKESLAAESKCKTKIEYEKFLVCHRAAAFLGQEFERVRPPGFPPIRFCDAHIMQLLERWPEQPFCIFEEQIAFRFEKYNSNTGYCAPNPTLLLRTNHDAVQAFSHWTYHFTEGKLMVVDCQGGYDPNKSEFIMTSPAIHCINMTQYGDTNLGTRGFEYFFGSHVCNHLCAALGLSCHSATGF